MADDDQNQGAGEQALAPEVLAARAAEQRQRDAAALAEHEYDLARQAADVNQDGFRLGRGPGRYIGPPPPPPMLGAAAYDFAPPPAPQFATDTANAFTAATQALKAIAESLGSRSANNSRGRDGDIVIVKDISQVFDEVPVALLDRVKYLQSVVNRLNANTSGVRFKTDSETIQAIRVCDDATVSSNYRMYTFKNVEIVVPFAVVFSDAGKASTIMLSNSAGEDCYVPVPTRIMNKLSSQVYSYLYDKIPHSMRMLYSDCDKNDAFTLINRIKTLQKQSLYTPHQVLEQRLEKITISKLDDWNMFEPDMNDIIAAYDEHEKLKQITPAPQSFLCKLSRNRSHKKLLIVPAAPSCTCLPCFLFAYVAEI